MAPDSALSEFCIQTQFLLGKIRRSLACGYWRVTGYPEVIPGQTISPFVDVYLERVRHLLYRGHRALGQSCSTTRLPHSSDGGDAIGSFCGAVDGLDEGNAAAAFEAIAGRRAILLDGLEEIFEDGLVAAKIADGGGGGAEVFVEGSGFDGGWSVTEIGGDDAVVLEDDGAFGAGNFDAARIAGIGGGSGVENAQGAAREFENGGGGVFGFDLVKLRGGAGLDAYDITEQPEEQIDGVNALIDQSAAAIERERAAPARASVVFGRAIPLHAGVDE